MRARHAGHADQSHRAVQHPRRRAVHDLLERNMREDPGGTVAQDEAGKARPRLGKAIAQQHAAPLGHRNRVGGHASGDAGELQRQRGQARGAEGHRERQFGQRPGLVDLEPDMAEPRPARQARRGRDEAGRRGSLPRAVRRAEDRAVGGALEHRAHAGRVARGGRRLGGRDGQHDAAGGPGQRLDQRGVAAGVAGGIRQQKVHPDRRRAARSQRVDPAGEEGARQRPAAGPLDRGGVDADDRHAGIGRRRPPDPVAQGGGVSVDPGRDGRILERPPRQRPRSGGERRREQGGAQRRASRGGHRIRARAGRAARAPPPPAGRPSRPAGPGRRRRWR